MKQELAVEINNWILEQSHEEINLEQEWEVDEDGDLIVNEHSIINQNMHLVSIAKILEMTESHYEGNVIAVMDASINNQDDDISTALDLIDKYDEDKNLLRVNVRLPNDCFGNYNGYIYLIQ